MESDGSQPVAFLQVNGLAFWHGLRRGRVTTYDEAATHGRTLTARNQKMITSLWNATRAARAIIVLLCGLGHAAPAIAFQYTTDQSLDIIRKMVTDGRDKTICVPPTASLRDVVLPLLEFIRVHHPDRTEAFTNNDLYEALTALNPCPFDASANGAVEASADEVVGFWKIAADSRGLSPHVFNHDPYPVPCGTVAYFKDGDVRTVVSNELPCASTSPDVLTEKHRAPRTITWTYAPPNVMTITRPDEPGFIEVWNLYLVDRPFVARDVTFKRGDLLMYLVQYNDQRATTFRTLYFRHLERLVESTGSTTD
jgi:hypothetical protein